MGDNDFTAGDPWGLPIEESEEHAADETSVAPVNPADDADNGNEPGADYGWPATAVEIGDETREAPDRDEGTSHPASEQPSAIDEPIAVSQDPGWWSSPEETPPPAIDQEPVDEVSEHEVAGESDESSETDGEEYTFKAPARTPLSQMIAAAQSVVSSVQGTQETYGAEETDDLAEPEPSAAVTPFPVEMVERDDAAVELREELPAEPAVVSFDRTAGEDDLPAEPPAWLITDSGTEERLPEPLEEAAEAWEAGTDSILTPADIEASIAELATPAETPYAEDRFDMPEDAESAREFRDVDMDSSPGVYSELHYLAEEDDQAEALLREAAVAFGQAGESVVPLENNVADITKPPPDAGEIDSFAKALATGLPAEDTPLETIDDLLPELDQETPPDAEQIDSFAEALAAELQTEDTPLETIDDLLPELDQETPPDAEQIDSFAEALAAELQTEGTPLETIDDLLPELPAVPELFDSDIPAYLSDVELGEALAGLSDSATGDLSREIDGVVDSTEDAPATGWGELASPVAAAQENRLEHFGGDEREPIVESVGWADDEPGFAAVASAEEENGSEADSETLDGASDAVITEDGAVDSPVAWGTRYRDAHQGWIEDDEGRSTWRPIVTSGQSVAGWDIDIYLGMVSGDVGLDPPGPENIVAEVAAAREAAGRRMLDEALARGAHAVVGVTFAIHEVAGAVLVAASGVAVTLRTPA